MNGNPPLGYPPPNPEGGTPPPEAQPGGQNVPGYGPPPGPGGDGGQHAPGYPSPGHPSPGYGPPPGYSSPPGVEPSPPGYSPPGYPPPGYGPPPGQWWPSGQAPPPGYGAGPGQASPPPGYGPPAGYRPQPPRRGSHGLLVTVLVLVVVGLAAGGSYLAFGGSTGAAGPGVSAPAPAEQPAKPPGASAAPSAATKGLFEAPQPWTKDVSGLAPSERSEAIIGALTGMGGWGNGNALQIDFGIPLLVADGSAPRQTITAIADGYCYDGPDCDPVPLDMPLPAGGHIEGSEDYTCDPSSDDCHLLVVEPATKKLYELYNATQAGENFTARGAFVWDLTKSYPDGIRGDQCTSADAAGFPIAGLLTTADEVARGEVPHALRVILPNDRMKAGVFVHPAGHAGGPSSENSDAPPYGVRFRLNAAFDESPFNPSERVVIKALKTYGMLLSDGGNIALTFADDRTSTAKWEGLGITAQSFNAIGAENFQVVDLGPEIKSTNECVRNR